MLSGVLTTAAPVGGQQSCPIALLFQPLLKQPQNSRLGLHHCFSFTGMELKGRLHSVNKKYSNNFSSALFKSLAGTCPVPHMGFTFSPQVTGMPLVPQLGFHWHVRTHPPLAPTCDLCLPDKLLAEQATPRAARGTAEARVAPRPWGFALVSRAEQTGTVWPLHCLNLLVFLSGLIPSSTLSRLFFILSQFGCSELPWFALEKNNK